MTDSKDAIDQFRAACDAAAVHTIEIGVPDTLGHLRGKRVPIERFFRTTMVDGVGIADAIFVLDIQNDMPDNEFINMDSGYLDCRLKPDMSTGRILTHRPGYAIVMADAYDQHGDPHPLAPRNVLRNQIQRCREANVDPVMATELEFYLTYPDWTRVQDHIQYSSLTDAMALESVLAEMRQALQGAGMEVESSNAEYGPGQIEINIGHGDALSVADNTALFKSIVKQVAASHGLRATFMPKPFADHSGSGMHVHTSLASQGANVFADSIGLPNTQMEHWTAGQLKHGAALMLLATPTINGPKRIQPYTFAPTHAHWGLDNRTVMLRCICENSPANRVEYRAAGAGANPYLLAAGLLAAGVDGLKGQLKLPPMTEGDAYTHPGDAPLLPASLSDAIAAFHGSELAESLGAMFSSSYISMGRAEAALGAEMAPDPEDVNDWERARYAEHS